GAAEGGVRRAARSADALAPPLLGRALPPPDGQRVRRRAAQPRCARAAARGCRRLSGEPTHPGDVPGLAALVAGDAQRLDAHDQPVDLGVGVRSAQIALRETLDVVVRTLFRGVDQATLDLGPAEHVAWVRHDQRDTPSVTLGVAEPVTSWSTVEPDQP